MSFTDLSKQRGHLFALADCNSFYAQCERVFRPDLEKKPVIVLSNNDGCIVACSAEAKALGIRRGSPLFQSADLIRKHAVAVFSSNYVLYGDLSARVMTLLGQAAADLEVYSIDEAFLNLDGMDAAMCSSFAQKLRRDIYAQLSLPVSIGISSTKTLAKAANHLAKKDATLHGVKLLLGEEEIDSALKRLPTEKLWGIGHRYSITLRSYGIVTAYDLKKADDNFLRRRLTVNGLRTAWELRGVSCIPLTQAPPPKKMITCSRSFGQALTQRIDLEEAIASMVTIAAEKLRHEKRTAEQLLVFLSTNPYGREQFYMDYRTLTLPWPTLATQELISAGLSILSMIFKPGYTYKKAGVILTELKPQENVQLSMFQKNAPQLRTKALMQALDEVNREWGRGTLRFAATGRRKNWVMKQGSVSPRYTTRWNELRKVA